MEAFEIRAEADLFWEKGLEILQSEDSITTAVELLQKAYGLAEMVDYPEAQIKIPYRIGIAYLSMSDNPNATRYFYLSKKQAETLNDSINQAKALSGLALVMFNLNKWDEAIKNLNLSKKLTQKSTNRLSSTQDYLLGVCYYRKGELEKAKDLLSLAYEDAKNEKNLSRQREAELYLVNIASLKNPNVAHLTTYNRLIREFDLADEKVGMCYALEGKARTLYGMDDAEYAFVFAQEALSEIKKSDLLFPLHSILDINISCAYKLGKYQDAARYLKELRDLERQTLNENSSTQVALLMAQYEFDKKEEDFNSQMQQKNRERVILFSIVLVLVLLAFLILFSRKSIVKERKRSDKLLHNILPNETILELKKHGVASAKAHKEVTVVFADVDQFTRIASDLDPEILVRILDAYFKIFDRIVKESGVEKIKTIGDAYMFAVGLHEQDKNSAELAIEVCLDILDEINRVQDQLMTQFGRTFQFRFGMHTGNVVSGVVGTVKYAFDIWGDAVNIAARMEQNGSIGRVNVSESTYSLAKNSFYFEERGKVKMKNRGEMRMYFASRKEEI
jgi:class 3 adenylate cyclase